MNKEGNKMKEKKFLSKVLAIGFIVWLCLCAFAGIVRADVPPDPLFTYGLDVYPFLFIPPPSCAIINGGRPTALVDRSKMEELIGTVILKGKPMLGANAKYMEKRSMINRNTERRLYCIVEWDPKINKVVALSFNEEKWFDTGEKFIINHRIILDRGLTGQVNGCLFSVVVEGHDGRVYDFVDKTCPSQADQNALYEKFVEEMLK